MNIFLYIRIFVVLEIESGCKEKGNARKEGGPLD